MCKESMLVQSRARSRRSCEELRYRVQRGENKLRECFVEDGLSLMAKVRRTQELSRVRRRLLKEGEGKEPSWKVVGRRERQRTLRAFANEGIAAKATRLVQNSKPLKERR